MCTYLFDRAYDEGAAAGHLDDDSHKLGVGGAEAAVVGVARDLEVVIGAVPSRRRAENVTKLGAPHTSE